MIIFTDIIIIIIKLLLLLFTEHFLHARLCSMSLYHLILNDSEAETTITFTFRSGKQVRRGYIKLGR